MRTITLAKFDRDYHHHAKFKKHFTEALESFLEDVMAWKAVTGVEFDCELILERDKYYDCEVSAVVAKFNDDNDYAFYKMQMPAEKRATRIEPKGDGTYYFSGWKEIKG